MKPLAVVATCGTTSTASVDPIPAIAAICREQNLWLHIDAAYGGGLALLPEERAITAGWASADSLVINPHKMLFVPFDFSVLYVRDLERLRRVFSLVPEYLRGDTVEAERNYMDYGVPLGRRFRALKAWMVFRTFGRSGIAARIREHLRLAKLFGEWVTASPDFELSAPVSMGVVCFRGTKSKPEDLDSFNSQIVERVNCSGRAYLNQTKLRGRTAIRLGLGNVLTTEKHLRDGWELIQETARSIVSGAGSKSPVETGLG
jgi:aromatic-L-amino-acid decarboxylase